MSALSVEDENKDENENEDEIKTSRSIISLIGEILNIRLKTCLTLFH